MTGKVELVFEGEREGPLGVAERLLGQGIKAVFERVFPPAYAPGKAKGKAAPEGEEADAYKPIVDWFAEGNGLVLNDGRDDLDGLRAVPGLEELVRTHLSASPYGFEEHELGTACELVLEGLHQSSVIAKDRSPDGVRYGDMLRRMFAGFEEGA